jgi:soluble lytic murein transglycosylase-like protein
MGIYYLITLCTLGQVSGGMEATIRKINPQLDQTEAYQYSILIKRYAKQYGIDPRLAASVIAVESRFKNTAKGQVGEIGLMQLNPRFHGIYIQNTEERDEYLFDIDNNIAIGLKYLSSLKGVFETVYGNTRWVEHYNRGPNRKPRKFSYYYKVMQYYEMFGGDLAKTADATGPKSWEDNARRPASSRKTHIADRY